MDSAESLNTGIPLPGGFAEQWRRRPGFDADAFLAAMCRPPEVSVKLNRRKADMPAEMILNPSPAGEDSVTVSPVGWSPSGVYLDRRPSFTLNPLLHAGLFYVQDASSMIYEHLAGRALRELDPSAPPLLLDLCAAPGGKTTSIINAIPDGSRIVANEVMPRRAPILRENLLKWGYPGVDVTSSPTARFAAAGEIFDIVAVDAPCSGEGMMRKEEVAATQWSPALVAKCAALQREILADAAEALKPGGILIYSTCTFNTEENEDNLRYAVEELGLLPLDPEVDPAWGIGRELEGEYPALRFMPHLTRGEGLFAAMLRKPGQHIARGRREDKFLNSLADKFHLLQGAPPAPGKGAKEMPAPELPLSTDFPADAYPRWEVNLPTALSYLRRETLTPPPGLPRGLAVVTFAGHPLGFVKNLGARANNLFPKEWKIRFL